MNQTEMLMLVAEIDRALDAPIEWIEDRDSLKEHGAVSHRGRVIQNDGGGWLSLAVEFPVGEGKTSVSGTATKLGTIVHLPPELARKAVRRSKET